MNHFILIGISDQINPELPGRVKTLLATHTIFSGGKRHYQIVKSILPPNHLWIDVTVPIKDVFQQYKGIHEEIIIFASGDPLFYGLANTLKREFPNHTMEVYPYFHSLQMLAQYSLLSYQNMVHTSVTGRSWDELNCALIQNQETIGVLTDRRKTASVVAQHLLEYGYNNYKITVGEAMGGLKQKVLNMSLEEAANSQFNSLSCLILHRTHSRKRPLGLPDSDFKHLEGRPNMITKMPIRLTTLSLLDLSNRKCFWDVGFCTASVSIEARLNYPKLTICSFEQREESNRLFELNTRRMGAPGIHKLMGNFLDQQLTPLPKPDAVFIGGHGGKLTQIMTSINHVLSPMGVIVINSVSEKSQQEFRKICTHMGYPIVDQTTLMVENHNPITIIKAQKPA